MEINPYFVKTKILEAQMARSYPPEPEELKLVKCTGAGLHAGRLRPLEAHLLVTLFTILKNEPSQESEEGKNSFANWFTQCNLVTTLLRNEVAMRCGMGKGDEFTVGPGFELFIAWNIRSPFRDPDVPD